MPRIPFKKAVEDFVETQSKMKDWAQKTQEDYKRELLRIRKTFAGRKPSCISGDEILNYAETNWSDLSPKTKSYYWNILKIFMEYVGNQEINKIKFHIGNVKDRSVNWLSKEECELIRDVVEDMGGIYMMIFHLGRDLGLRRCEMQRLKWEHINFRMKSISIHGKYDKWRSMPFHPLTEEYLERWEKKRDKMLERAKQYSKDVKDPKHVLCWQRFGSMGSMGNTVMDKRLKDIEERAAVELGGFHILRRTFARRLYNSGVQIMTIRDLLGHESVEVTQRYIGVQEDKKRDALEIEFMNEKEMIENENLNLKE
ncbi:MAG: tyrosine-type recombinase/integrase [Candidatus Saliniplasma sp.]